MQFLAPDDGRKPRLKHVERIEINKLRNVASCWLYSANTFPSHEGKWVNEMTGFIVWKKKCFYECNVEI